jgi:hypothetical protein
MPWSESRSAHEVDILLTWSPFGSCSFRDRGVVGAGQADGRGEGRIAEAAGHCGPHQLPHLLSWAVWDDPQTLDTVAAWAAEPEMRRSCIAMSGDGLAAAVKHQALPEAEAMTKAP